MYKKLIAVITFSALVMTGLAWAEAAKKETPDAIIEKIQTELKTMFRGEEADSVKKSAFPGLYEVIVGTEVIYVSEDVNYVFYGSIIDRKNKINLTKVAQDEAEKAYAVKRKAIMAKQDPAQTITYKAKNEKEVLTVFTDIDCPYCAKIHKEVPALNAKGITVQYYLFPRAGVGSPSYKKAVSAWCADNKQEALTKAKNREAIPAKDCENPVAAQYKLGQEIGVTGTPALITESGTLIPGYMPADALIAQLAADKAANEKN